MFERRTIIKDLLRIAVQREEIKKNAIANR
jgi:hypothetical protein